MPHAEAPTIASTTIRSGTPADRIDHALSRLEEALIVILLGGAAILNFAQVAGRYTLGVSVSAFEEISVYLVIWMIFVGMGRADSLGQSIALDILYAVVGPTARHRLGQARDLLQVVFALAMTVVTARSAAFSWQIGETSVSKLAAPIWIVMAIMPPAFLLLAFRTALRLAHGSNLPSPTETVE